MADLSINIDYIGGNCPVQAEGHIGGKPFYFRARGERWTIGIGGNDCVTKPEWFYEEPYGEKPYEAGWMPQHVALAMIAKALSEYCKDA